MQKLKLFFRVKTYLIKDKLHCIFNYYSNVRFALLDIVFSLIYLFINPYKLSRRFLEKKNISNIHVYGETPIKTIAKIAKEFSISSEHSFLELGSGRGNSTFWLNRFIKCKINAIEWIGSFINISKFLASFFRLKNVKFIKEDMFDHDMSQYDIIYLYGTCLSEFEILKLINNFKKSKAKIITISYSLDEYDDNFITEKSIDVSFPWGETKAYLNAKGVNNDTN